MTKLLTPYKVLEALGLVFEANNPFLYARIFFILKNTAKAITDMVRKENENSLKAFAKNNMLLDDEQSISVVNDIYNEICLLLFLLILHRIKSS